MTPPTWNSTRCIELCDVQSSRDSWNAVVVEYWEQRRSYWHEALAVFWSSREPRTLCTNQDMTFLGISFASQSNKKKMKSSPQCMSLADVR